MFDHPFAHFVGDIQPRMFGVALLQLGEDAVGLPLMVIAAKVFHQIIQRRLAHMAKGRMTEIMGQTDRLGQILIAPQRPRHRPPHLRHFDAVGQPVAIMVAF